MSRDSILQAVREATRTNPIQSVKPTHFDTMIYDRENLLSVYTQYQKANMAHLITTTKDSLVNSINEIIKECDISFLALKQAFYMLKSA